MIDKYYNIIISYCGGIKMRLKVVSTKKERFRLPFPGEPPYRPNGVDSAAMDILAKKNRKPVQNIRCRQISDKKKE